MHRIFAVPVGSPAPPLLYEVRGWFPRVLPTRLSGLSLALLVVAALLVGTGLLAVSARVRFELGFSPVPITGQTFAVLLIGAVYGSRLGAVTVITYLIEGVSGLPVFAGGASGWAYFSATSGGYFVGFIGAAYMVGWLAERGWDRSALTMAVAMAVRFKKQFERLAATLNSPPLIWIWHSVALRNGTTPGSRRCTIAPSASTSIAPSAGMLGVAAADVINSSILEEKVTGTKGNQSTLQKAL